MCLRALCLCTKDFSLLEVTTPHALKGRQLLRACTPPLRGHPLCSEYPWGQPFKQTGLSFLEGKDTLLLDTEKRQYARFVDFLSLSIAKHCDKKRACLEE
jgi:hypothetical protein